MSPQFCRKRLASRHDVIWLQYLRPSQLKSAGTGSFEEPGRSRNGMGSSTGGALPPKGARRMPYRLTPMGTILEGGFDEVMQVVGDCFRALEPDCARIGMNLKMDYRAGTESRMQSKVEAVERHLGRKVQT